MPNLGPLQQSLSYTLEVQTTSKVAIIVVNVRRDRISEVESLMFDQSDTTAQSRTINSNVARVLFLASAPINQTGIVKITQGSQKFEVTLSPDADIVFDLS